MFCSQKLYTITIPLKCVSDKMKWGKFNRVIRVIAESSHVFDNSIISPCMKLRSF